MTAATFKVVIVQGYPGWVWTESCDDIYLHVESDLSDTAVPLRFHRSVQLVQKAAETNSKLLAWERLPQQGQASALFKMSLIWRHIPRACVCVCVGS